MLPPGRERERERAREAGISFTLEPKLPAGKLGTRRSNLFLTRTKTSHRSSIFPPALPHHHLKSLPPHLNPNTVFLQHPPLFDFPPHSTLRVTQLQRFVSVFPPHAQGAIFSKSDLDDFTHTHTHGPTPPRSSLSRWLPDLDLNHIKVFKYLKGEGYIFNETHT